MFKKIKDIIIKIKSGDEKSKTLGKNILLSFIVKGFAIIVSLVNMPLFMDYFEDSSVLGLWFTILSMLNWILLFDLGIGNGLRNYLVIALEKKDNIECKKLIASAYCSGGVLVLLISIIAGAAIPHINWNSVCNIAPSIISPQVLVSVIRMLVVGILLQFLLKMISSILYAMQKPALPNFLVLLSNVLLLLSTVILNTGDSQRNLVRLSYAYILTANLPMLIATVYVFAKPLRDIGIDPRYWAKSQTKQILGLGISFLALQLLSMASFNTKEFYIMRFVSPDAVVPYQIYHKLFSLVSTFFVLAMTPMWSAITQAAAQNDSLWIKKNYKNTITLFGIFSICSVAVVMLSQVLVNIWLGAKSISMNYGYGLLFAFFNIEYMWINLHSSFENGLKRLKAQELGYLLSTILLPVIGYFITKATGAWISVLVANVLSLLPICVLQFIYMRAYFKNSMEVLQ